jgi:hypothetical protein
MSNIAPRHSGRKHKPSGFDFTAKRRREIVLHARYVGAAETQDFSRWLIAWVWHNPNAKDQIWAVMEAAKRMGGEVTEAKASEITEEASITRKHLSADNLAMFLGVTYQQREALGLTTIGSINVKKRARKELRKYRARKARESRRRSQGVRPRAEYEANSLSATKPWEQLGVSRRTWERRVNKARDASVSTPIFLSSEDRPATPKGEQGCPSEPSAREDKKGVVRLATATTLAVDLYATLPLELRLLALCLPVSQMRMAA